MFTYPQVLHKKAEFFAGTTLGPQRSTSGPPVEPQGVREAYESFVYGGPGYKDKYKDEWNQGFAEGYEDAARRTAYNIGQVPSEAAKLPSYVGRGGVFLGSLWYASHGEGSDEKPLGEMFSEAYKNYTENPVTKGLRKYERGVDAVNPLNLITSYKDLKNPKYLTEDDLAATDLLDAGAVAAVEAGVWEGIPAWVRAARAGKAPAIGAKEGFLAASKAFPGWYKFDTASELGVQGLRKLPDILEERNHKRDVDELLAFYGPIGYTKDQIENYLYSDNPEAGISLDESAFPDNHPDIIAYRKAGLTDDQIREALLTRLTQQYGQPEPQTEPQPSNAEEGAQGTTEDTNTGATKANTENNGSNPPPPAKKDYSPYIAAGLAGTTGVLAANAITSSIPAIKKRKILKHLLNLAAGGALGYAAWQLTQPTQQA